MRKTLLTVSAAAFAWLLISVSSVHATETTLYGNGYFTNGNNGPASVSFVATGDLYSGSGPNSVFNITGITGSVDENGTLYSISSINPTTGPGVVTYYYDGDVCYVGSGGCSYDNLLSLASPNVDINGLDFFLNNGNNVGLYTGSFYDFTDFTYAYGGLNVSETPEPRSALLFGTGLLAIALFMRKRLCL